jgi:transposase-like protein
MAQILEPRFIPEVIESWDDLVGVVVDILQVRDAIVRASERLIGEAIYRFVGSSAQNNPTSDSIRSLCGQLSNALGNEPSPSTLYKWWRAAVVQHQHEIDEGEFPALTTLPANTLYEVATLTPDKSEQREILTALAEGEVSLQDVRETVRARQRYPSADISPVVPVRFLYDRQGQWWSISPKGEYVRVVPGTWYFSIMCRRLKGEPFQNDE